jgi:hypothetical protein
MARVCDIYPYFAADDMNVDTGGEFVGTDPTGMDVLL